MLHGCCMHPCCVYVIHGLALAAWPRTAALVFLDRFLCCRNVAVPSTHRIQRAIESCQTEAATPRAERSKLHPLLRQIENENAAASQRGATALHATIQQRTYPSSLCLVQVGR